MFSRLRLRGHLISSPRARFSIKAKRAARKSLKPKVTQDFPIVSPNEAENDFIEKFVSKIALNGNENILEIGCKYGKLTSVVSSKLPNGHITAIDSSETVQEAQNSDALSNVSFQTGDVLSLTPATFEKKFDVAISFGHLQNLGYQLESHLDAFANISSVLKPGGRFFFALSFSLPPRIQNELHILARGESSKFKNYLKDFDTSLWWGDKSLQHSLGGDAPHTAYYHLLSASKLHPLTVQRYTHVVNLASEKDLMTYFASILGPEFERIPVDVRPTYLQRLMDRLHKGGFIGDRGVRRDFVLKRQFLKGEAVLL